MRFAQRLCTAWTELGPADVAALRRVFSEAEAVEVIALCAWQFGGPPMMSSWGAESYKRDGRVVLEALPVRPAYLEAARSGASLPAIPPPPIWPTSELLQRAARRQSPPPAWVELLAAHPVIPSTWMRLYDAVVEGGRVEPRIKQLLRALVAERLDCPAWAPAESPPLLAAGVGPTERQWLRAGELDRFNERERAALAYAEALLGPGHVADEEFALLASRFDEGEIVELGYAIAVQNGAARVLRVVGR